MPLARLLGLRTEANCTKKTAVSGVARRCSSSALGRRKRRTTLDWQQVARQPCVHCVGARLAPAGQAAGTIPRQPRTMYIRDLTMRTAGSASGSAPAVAQQLDAVTTALQGHVSGCEPARGSPLLPSTRQQRSRGRRRACKPPGVRALEHMHTCVHAHVHTCLQSGIAAGAAAAVQRSNQQPATAEQVIGCLHWPGLLRSMRKPPGGVPQAASQLQRCN